MKNTTFLASTAALLLSAGVAVAAGQAAQNIPAPQSEMAPPPAGRPAPHGEHREHGRGRKPDGLPRELDGLNLTGEQKTKIKTILEQNRDSRPADPTAHRAEFLQKMQQRQQQEQQLIGSKTFDEQAARRLIAERQQEHATRELQMLKTCHAVFQVLPPVQQQQQLLAEQQWRHQRFEEHVQRRRTAETK